MRTAASFAMASPLRSAPTPTMPALDRLGRQVQRQFTQHRWPLRLKVVRETRSAWDAAAEAMPHDAAATSKKCLLDLKNVCWDGPQGRRFHALVWTLAAAGFEVGVVPRRRFLQTGHRIYKRRALLRTRPISPESASRSAFDLCITDHAACADHGHRGERYRQFHLVDGQFGSTDADCQLPFTPHPDPIDAGVTDPGSISHLRASRRRWPIVFAGFQRPSGYDRLWPEYRHFIARHRVIATAKSCVNGRTHEVRSSEDYAAVRDADAEMLINVTLVNCVAEDFRIPSDQWFETLASSRFFLAAPGCRYPMSHNAVEAMVLGTVPIIQYGDLFDPPLRDGENCLAYHDEASLRSAILRAETMDADRWRQMSASAIRYYNENMAPEAVVARWLATSGNAAIDMFPYLKACRPAARRKKSAA